jgi:hypothetical protein
MQNITVIKRTIHGLYSRKIAPTVSIIHKEIKNYIKISKFTLTQLSLILDILTNETIGFFVAFSLLKKANNNFFTNFWHSGDKSDFLPILQKMQNITIIYERNAC